MKKLFLSIALALIFVLPQELVAQHTEVIQPDSSLTLFQKVEKWYDNNMNYGSITALMAVESTFFPLPSEIVIPPAAYIASKPNSHLNIFLVILFGTIGAFIGASINYWLAVWLGRPLIYKLAETKFGKMLLLSSAKIQKTEDYFNKHGKISTFIGRLVPGIRHLISIPAGLARMNYVSFTLFTLLGAGIWNTILALMGYLAHGEADMIDKYSEEFKIMIYVLLISTALYFVAKYFIKKNKK